ncbi:hypothetical protein N9994_00930 [bacterium]|nr:hypothetical protein [bacterium]
MLLKKQKINLLKTLIMSIIVLFSFNGYSQSCMNNDYDVISYLNYKTFESKDGTFRIDFGSSSAKVIAGGNTYTYVYDSYRYLGNGHKGMITMSNTTSYDGLKLYVSCTAKMVTDNSSVILLEKEW